ncbi:MAG TPA: FkbM family methyltransferase [Dongiaceae bacterium]|nr:FkbM family methyltransferase [Dongiaceae bacterium]
MPFRQLRNRTGLLSGYFAAERNFSIGLAETVRKGVLKPTCSTIGARYIARIEDAGEYEKVHFRNICPPLYWPKAIGRFDLYKAATDCLHPDDWHHYEVPETTVKRGDVVLDCGAAEGIFALSVAERAGKVVLFEPSPDFRSSLARTFGNMRSATVVPAALGSKEGKAFLDGGSLYGVVRAEGGIPIDVTTIDAWSACAGTRVDYLKGDLESYEFEVLQGAVNLIQRDKPKIAFTVYHPGNDWKQMMSFLKRLVPAYRFRVKGLSYNDNFPRPVMLHAWT